MRADNRTGLDPILPGNLVMMDIVGRGQDQVTAGIGDQQGLGPIRIIVATFQQPVAVDEGSQCRVGGWVFPGIHRW